MAKKKELTNEQLVGELLTRFYNQRNELEYQQSRIDDKVNVLDDVISTLEQVSGDIELL